MRYFALRLSQSATVLVLSVQRGLWPLSEQQQQLQQQLQQQQQQQQPPRLCSASLTAIALARPREFNAVTAL